LLPPHEHAPPHAYGALQQAKGMGIAPRAPGGVVGGGFNLY
jgi:hypothetical protein